ncbi:MAG: DUF4238 domain-containing protein [Clostridia bacterium]
MGEKNIGAKKHHCVPRAYLKYFANEKNIIHVIDKKKSNEYDSNIADVAVQNNYNTISPAPFVSTPNGDPLYYEKEYCHLIEHKIPKIIDNIIAACVLSNRKFPILTKEIKEDLSRFIAIQFYRVPEQRKRLYEFGETIVKETDREVLKELNEATLDDKSKNEFIESLNQFSYTPDINKLIHLKISTNEMIINEMAQSLINNHYWMIYDNTFYKEFPFVTSDNPIILYNISDKKVGNDGNGTEEPATVILIALTPKYILILYHKNCIFDFSKTETDICHSLIDDLQFVKNINKIQYKQDCEKIFTPPVDLNY